MLKAETAGNGLARRAWKAWVLVVAAGLIAVSYSHLHLRLFGQNEPLARWSYDLAARGRPPVPLPGVLLLEIDAETSQRLGQPVNRTNYARLIGQAGAAGSRLVFFDLIFDRPQSPGEDGVFAQSLGAATNVILAEALKRLPMDTGLVLDRGTPGTELEHTTITAVLPVFRRDGWSGLVDLEPDADGVIRRLYGAFRNSRHPDRLTAPWRGAGALTNLAGPFRERWLRYYGPGGKVFTHRGLAAALAGPEFPPGTSLIFVGVNQAGRPGQQATELRDQYRGPYRGGMYSGLELHATAVLNLLQDDWLARLHPAIQLLAVTAWGTLIVALLAWRKTWWMQALVAVLAVLFALLLVRLGWWLGHWWPWLIPAGLQTAVALAATPWLPEPPLGPPRVFISYRQGGTGETHARTLEQALRARRIPAYLAPGWIAAGDDYERELKAAIERAPNFLLVLTPSARNELDVPESWVRLELTHALKTRRHILVARTKGGSQNFSADDLKDAASLLRKLRAGGDPLSAHLWQQLPEGLRALAEPSPEALGEALARIMQAGPLYDPARFAGVTLSSASRTLLARETSAAGYVRLNRRLLQDAYPQEVYDENEFVPPLNLAAFAPDPSQPREVHQVELDPGKDFERAMREIVGGLK